MSAPLIVMYYSDKCGFCTKAKAAIAEAGLEHLFDMRDTAKEPPPPECGNGVPSFKGPNGKVARGFDQKKGVQGIFEQLELPMPGGGKNKPGPMPMPRPGPMPMPRPGPMPMHRPGPPKPSPLPPEHHDAIPPGVIIMFIMPTCGFCKKGLDMFKNEIASGMIVPLEGGPVQAFPSFASFGGGFSEGLPQSLDHLLSMHPMVMEGYRRYPNRRTRENYIPQPSSNYNYWNYFDKVKYENWNVGCL